MTIDGQKVSFDNEKNILQVIRKVGIDLPTFCYHSELSIYGACRMCVVQDKKGKTFASCSELPKDGMEIQTNTPSLQKHRRMILELILSNHDRDCTICEKNGKCKLQELAARFGIKKLRFEPKQNTHTIDESSPSIIRNPNKCILCGDCVRMCEEVQGVGVLGFAFRGTKIEVTPAFNKPLSHVDCTGCGQCAAVCPTGALLIKNDVQKVWNAIHDKKKKTFVMIAPAVRVALGEEFGLSSGEIVTGKLVSALKKIGFDFVYDMGLSADLTVMEESREFLDRLENGDKLPLFTSCCPAWIKYAEQRHPELLENISSCRSPQQMFGALIKEHFGISENLYNGDCSNSNVSVNINDNDTSIDTSIDTDTVVVSIVPCTAKKAEALRPELETNGVRDIDIVITTQELANMIKEAGFLFNELEPEAFDMPFGLSSGAGILFGATGGVTEAVLRRCCSMKTPVNLKEIEFSGVRGLEGVKEASIRINGKTINVAIANGLNNAENLIKEIQAGSKQYDFVEVMACPSGCIGGAGQPVPSNPQTNNNRAKGIYSVDRISQIKRPEENPMIIALYNGVLKSKSHILHVPKQQDIAK